MRILIIRLAAVVVGKLLNDNGRGRVANIVGLYGDLNGSSVASESDEHQRPFTSRDAGRDNRGDNSRSDLEDMEAVARVVAECGDEMENVLLSKCTDDDRLW